MHNSVESFELALSDLMRCANAICFECPYKDVEDCKGSVISAFAHVVGMCDFVETEGGTNWPVIIL